MVDSELIAQAQAGKESARERLYTEYYTPVYRYIYVRVRHRETAEDLVQSVFFKLYRALPGWEVEADTSLLAYLFTIAKRTIIDHGRKSVRQIDMDDESVLYHADQKGHSDPKDNILSRLNDSLQSLLPAERTLILDYYVVGRSYTELAAAGDTTEAAIRQRCSRIVRKLREHQNLEMTKNKDENQ